MSFSNKKTQNHIYKEEDIIKPEEGLSYQVRKNEVVYCKKSINF